MVGDPSAVAGKACRVVGNAFDSVQQHYHVAATPSKMVDTAGSRHCEQVDMASYVAEGSTSATLALAGAVMPRMVAKTLPAMLASNQDTGFVDATGTANSAEKILPLVLEDAVAVPASCCSGRPYPLLWPAYAVVVAESHE